MHRSRSSLQSASGRALRRVGELGVQLGTHAGLNGLFAPKGTPREVLRTLEGACEKAVKSERFAQMTARYSTVPGYLDSAAFAKFWEQDAKLSDEAVRLVGKV